jgi:hypothetical protein
MKKLKKKHWVILLITSSFLLCYFHYFLPLFFYCYSFSFSFSSRMWCFDNSDGCDLKDKVEMKDVVFIFNNVQKHTWYSLLKIKFYLNINKVVRIRL